MNAFHISNVRDPTAPQVWPYKLRDGVASLHAASVAAVPKIAGAVEAVRTTRLDKATLRAAGAGIWTNSRDRVFRPLWADLVKYAGYAPQSELDALRAQADGDIRSANERTAFAIRATEGLRAELATNEGQISAWYERAKKAEAALNRAESRLASLQAEAGALSTTPTPDTALRKKRRDSKKVKRARRPKKAGRRLSR